MDLPLSKRHQAADSSAGRTSGRPARPHRKRVVLADRRGTRRVTRTMTDLEEQTSVGEALIRNLVRAQLRTSLLLAALTLAVFGALPLLFWSLPEFASARLFGVGVGWILLGVLPFPFLLFVGFLSERRAERHERDFVHMVEN